MSTRRQVSDSWLAGVVVAIAAVLLAPRMASGVEVLAGEDDPEVRCVVVNEQSVPIPERIGIGDWPVGDLIDCGYVDEDAPFGSECEPFASPLYVELQPGHRCLKLQVGRWVPGPIVAPCNVDGVECADGVEPVLPAVRLEFVGFEPIFTAFDLLCALGSLGPNCLLPPQLEPPRALSSWGVALGRRGPSGVPSGSARHIMTAGHVPALFFSLAPRGPFPELIELAGLRVTQFDAHGMPVNDDGNPSTDDRYIVDDSWRAPGAGWRSSLMVRNDVAIIRLRCGHDLPCPSDFSVRPDRRAPVGTPYSFAGGSEPTRDPSVFIPPPLEERAGFLRRGENVVGAYHEETQFVGSAILADEDTFSIEPGTGVVLEIDHLGDGTRLQNEARWSWSDSGAGHLIENCRGEANCACNNEEGQPCAIAFQANPRPNVHEIGWWVDRIVGNDYAGIESLDDALYDLRTLVLVETEEAALADSVRGEVEIGFANLYAAEGATWVRGLCDPRVLGVGPNGVPILENMAPWVPIDECVSPGPQDFLARKYLLEARGLTRWAAVAEDLPGEVGTELAEFSFDMIALFILDEARLALRGSNVVLLGPASDACEDAVHDQADELIDRADRTFDEAEPYLEEEEMPGLALQLMSEGAYDLADAMAILYACGP